MRQFNSLILGLAAGSSLVSGSTLAEIFAPVATDDTYIVSERGTLTVTAPGVLDNDTDRANDPLSATVISDPTLGTLNAFQADGSFIYTPPAIPPIDIGLAEQCRTVSAGGNFRVQTVTVADVDADGEIELVSWTNNFITTYNAETCAIKSRVEVNPDLGFSFSNEPITLVNLDSDSELELVRGYQAGSAFIPPSDTDFHLLALNLDGTPVWGDSGLSAPVTATIAGSRVNDAGPSAVDLDGDGNVELVVGSARINLTPISQGSYVVAYEGATGEVRWEYTSASLNTNNSANGQHLAMADIDLDGTVEILLGNSVIDHNGSLEFQLEVDVTPNNGSAPRNKRIAIGNFDDDPFAEILGVDTNGHTLYEHTGEEKWFVPRIANADHEVTIAQLDDDAAPEYVMLDRLSGETDWSLQAYDTDGSPLWSHQDTIYTVGASRATTTVPVAFDFDRDGVDELAILYLEITSGLTPIGLYLFSGVDGTELDHVPWSQASGNNFYHTLTIADIDDDGAAEILAQDAAPEFDQDAIFVFEGLPGNPFPPARRLRNQKLYQPTMVNEDASIPTSVRPQWLIPGFNRYNFAGLVPGESLGTTDTFTYQANDGTADSNEAEVRITIARVSAPTIVSEPPLSGSPGIPYTYSAVATDSDLGDMTWTLVDAPTGMSVDSASGVVSWIPAADDLGSVRVQLIVTDADGNTDSQPFNVAVSPPPTLVSAVLPASRSVEVGTLATAFATVINTDSIAAEDCVVRLPDAVSAEFFFQASDPATNELIGERNQAVTIAPGAAQSFVIGITPSTELPASEVPLEFQCASTADAASVVGLNTLLLSASSAPVPDLIALVATTTNNGVMELLDNTGFFTAATINVGSAATITVQADVGGANLPMTLSLCQTDPATSVCINPAVPSTEPVTVDIAEGSTPTFAVFATASGSIPLDPARSRVFLLFSDEQGEVRGATSVAVQN